MQLSIWIIAISVVLGPVLLGLLLHRLGFSRAVTLGLGIVILGSALLLVRDPMDASDNRPISAPTQAATAPTPIEAPSAVSTTAASIEIEALRAQLAAIEVDQRNAASTATADLARAKAAHDDTRRALEAAKSRIASLEAAPPPAAPLASQPTTTASVDDKLKQTELRLAIAYAEIERLKAMLRAAEPVATAVPLPATPKPFDNAPPPPGPPPETKAETIAISATAAAPVPENKGAAIGRILAQAMSSRSFALVKLANDELVQGRRGNYFRIICPGPRNRPLSFGPGAYTFPSGYSLLGSCIKAVRSVLLDKLPSDAERRLYVQGYSGQRGFFRPKAFPSGDTHLKTFSYLPRIKGRDRFSTAKVQQTTGRRFTNTELPNLRAANVAHWIERSASGAITPEILEGELKPASYTAVQSFSLILQMNW